MTTTHRSLALVAVAGVATALIVPAQSVGSSPTEERDTVLTYRLVDKHAESTFIDEKRAGESVGDRYLAAATVRRQGRVAGRLQTDCAVLDRTYNGHLCQLALLLEDGELTLSGGGISRPLGEVPPTGDVFVVTGGTGAFLGAGGEMVAGGKNGNTLTITLVQPTGSPG
jgi:hypothetical protein